MVTVELRMPHGDYGLVSKVNGKYGLALAVKAFDVLPVFHMEQRTPCFSLQLDCTFQARL